MKKTLCKNLWLYQSSFSIGSILIFGQQMIDYPKVFFCSIPRSTRQGFWTDLAKNGITLQPQLDYVLLLDRAFQDLKL